MDPSLKISLNQSRPRFLSIISLVRSQKPLAPVVSTFYLCGKCSPEWLVNQHQVIIVSSDGIFITLLYNININITFFPFLQLFFSLAPSDTHTCAGWRGVVSMEPLFDTQHREGSQAEDVHSSSQGGHEAQQHTNASSQLPVLRASA